MIALIGIPTICTIIGWRYLRYQPPKLIRLFYGTEVPLFLLCLLRLFVLRELTPASTLMPGKVIVCTIAFLIELLRGYNRGNQILAGLQLIAHSLMLLTGIYIGLLLLFYAVPFAAFLLQEFLKFYWLENIGSWIGYVVLSIFYVVPIFFICG
ncbi:MAG: hypothetical protein F6K36_26485 [Symploca sp. SIO3C6]|nr:hypothetical protein [Symploca sp. SIO3C6]